MYGYTPDEMLDIPFPEFVVLGSLAREWLEIEAKRPSM